MSTLNTATNEMFPEQGRTAVAAIASASLLLIAGTVVTGNI
jgi:hypothetical protein